ncbi:MAG TPA: hypothetical protein VNO23_07515 [Candidatus Binatia bacterium]|nr:hypothetical protein [Candidatus Binatia bacterium]
MKPIDQAILADYAATALAARPGWDVPHEFATLHRDGDKLTVGALTVIDPAMPPSAYPKLMGKVAQRAAREDLATGKRTLYGYSLLIEAFGVAKPVNPAPEEAAQFDRDCRERRFHLRPDAVEIASIYVVDIHQRFWTSTRERASGQVQHHYCPTPDGAPGGAFITGLRAVAHATAARGVEALMTQPAYQPGETVRVLIEGRVSPTSTSTTTIAVEHGDSLTVLDTTDPTVSVSRLEPADGRPQPGEMWADAMDNEYFAVGGWSDVGPNLYGSDGTHYSWYELHRHPELGPIRRIRAAASAPVAPERRDEDVEVPF